MSGGSLVDPHRSFSVAEASQQPSGAIATAINRTAVADHDSAGLTETSAASPNC